TLQGGTYQGGYTKYFHRSKIIVLKASVWNQIVYTSDDSEVHSVAASLPGEEFDAKDITLASTGYLVGLSNMRMWKTAAGGSEGMVKKVLGSRGSQDIFTKYINVNSRNSSTGFYCENEISGATTLQQLYGYSYGNVDTYADDRDLILWELRTAGAGEAGVADVTDSVGASDSATASKTGDFPRTHTDNVGAVDSTDIQRDLTRPITDGASGDDAVARATEAARSVIDDVAADDDADVTTVGAFTVTDNVAADDIVTRATIAARLTTDNAAASDSVTGVKGV
ncbi:unnamed protein product, partial [marine sediment metagenome]